MLSDSTRNGERFDEDIIIDSDMHEKRGREQEVEITRRRSMSAVRPPPRLRKDMWTEVTKDLVIKEAIEEMGYDYEETTEFFYVIEYLQYVSLLHLYKFLIGTNQNKNYRRMCFASLSFQRISAVSAARGSEHSSGSARSSSAPHPRSRADTTSASMSANETSTSTEGVEDQDSRLDRLMRRSKRVMMTITVL